MSLSTWWENYKLRLLDKRGRTIWIVSFPLWLGLIDGAITDKPGKIVCCFVALSCFYLCSKITRSYFCQLQKALLEESHLAFPDKRLLAGVLLAAGAAVISLYLTRKPLTILVFASTAALGYYLNYYANTPKVKKFNLKDSEFTKLPPTLKKMLETAYANIIELQRSAQLLSQQESTQHLAQDLLTVIMMGKSILQEIKNHPEKIRQMRQFLVVYLPELVSISDSMQTAKPELQHGYIKLLKTAEQNFSNMKLQISAQNQSQLDSQIKVLRNQLQENISQHD